MRPQSARQHWFGVSSSDAIAPNVLLMERDRLDQYGAALDYTSARFSGVFQGITGMLNGRWLSVIYTHGPAHIADCVEFLSIGFRVRQLISTGSIGGLRIDIGDLLVADSCVTKDGYSLAYFRENMDHDDLLGDVVTLEAGNRPLLIPADIRGRLLAEFGCQIQQGRVFTVPAVSWEAPATLNAIYEQGFTAVDLETGPFLAACRRTGTSGVCVHWVTDRPRDRDFYQKYEADPNQPDADERKKHRQWLNLPRLILPVVDQVLTMYEP